jgi:hypothetical protein
MTAHKVGSGRVCFCSLESDGQFCVGAFDRDLASVAVKMLNFTGYCSTQKSFFPVNFDGSYYVSRLHLILDLPLPKADNVAREYHCTI